MFWQSSFIFVIKSNKKYSPLVFVIQGPSGPTGQAGADGPTGEKVSDTTIQFINIITHRFQLIIGIYTSFLRWQ